MQVIIITALFVVICFAESLFCYLMKKRTDIYPSEQKDDEEDAGMLEDKHTNSHSVVYNVLAWMGKTADDFTFLFFKMIGYFPSHAVRKFFYKYIFHMTIGKRAVIYYGLEARFPWKIKIGKGTIVGDKTILDARFGITIGENVNISTGAWMWTQQHDLNSRSFSCSGKGAGITIGDRAWISSRTTLLPGVCVGTGSVIAAGAVVTHKSIEAFSVWGGCACKENIG